MVRNLMVACVANLDLEIQEGFYFQYWLKPIEEKLSNVTDFIGEFIEKFDTKYESKIEIFAKQQVKGNPSCTKAKNIMIYANFYSLYEWRLSLINKGKEMNLLDPELMLQVTKELCVEMAEIISRNEKDSEFIRPVPPDFAKPRRVHK